MKKSLLKNNFKAINKTKRRFISILIMAFLGVGFYSGLVATSPDMLDTLDRYTDDNKMFDINVVSTLGLTDEDIDAIKQLEGIESVYGIQTKDSIAQFNEKESICKVIEYNENINAPTVIYGNLPENTDECLLDAGYTISDNIEEYIGKKIILENEDKDNDDNPIFTKKEFTVVGIAESPIYISSERGNTSIGSGNISFFVYVNEDVIKMDYYTEICATVDGAKEEVTNNDEYLKKVNPVIKKVEEIKKQREEARYNSLVDEATEKVNEAQKEYDDKKYDVDKELKNAEKKLNEAESKIEKSEKEIASQEKSLENQFKTAESKIKEAEKQINLKEKELENGKKELEKSKKDAEEEILAGQKKITKAKKELQLQKNELEKNKKTANKKIANAKEEIEEGKKELEDAKKEFQDNKKEAEKKLADAQKEINNAKDKIKKIEKAKWYIYDRLDNTGYTNIFDAIKTMSNISKMFPVIFYIVAVLISLTSMTRMIEEERIEIGTLKSLGYTNLQIISKYILYAFLACVIGGILGMTVGFYLLPNIVWIIYSMIYRIPNFYVTYQLGIGVKGILIAFACIGGATIFVAYKELKEMPAVLMRPKPPKNGKKIMLERLTFIWKKLSFSKKVTARNIFRYKKRAIMTIVGIAGCTGLMLTGFGIRDSVSDIPDSQFGKVFKYDASVSLLNTNGMNELEEYLSANDDVEDYCKTYATTGKLKKEKLSYDITTFVPDNLEEFKKSINLISKETKEEITLNDNGIVITDKVAEFLDVRPGDEIIYVDSDDIEYKLRVEDIAENYISHYVYMTKSFFEENIKFYETNMIFINTKNIEENARNKISEEILNIEGVASVSITTNMMGAVSDMLNTMNYVVVVLIVASALLAFVVLYNLANINIGERQREIATLKVLGFYDREVDNYINKESVIFTIIGVVIGLVFGTFLTSVLVASVEIDKLRFIRNIKPLSYIYSASITILFSLIVNWTIHFVLKRINMIESLKSVE